MAAWSSSSVAVVLVAGSFPFPAEVVEAAVGSAYLLTYLLTCLFTYFFLLIY